METNQIEFEAMLRIVAQEFKIRTYDMLGDNRRRPFVEARSIVYQLLRNQDYNYSQIAQLFNRDRSTIIYNLKQLDAWLKYDKPFKIKYELCKQKVYELAKI